MFRFIFQTILLLYIILLIYSIIDIQKFNINGIVLTLDEYEDIENEIKKLNPLIVNFNHNFSSEELPYNITFNNNNLNINRLYNNSDNQIIIEKGENILNIPTPPFIYNLFNWNSWINFYLMYQIDYCFSHC